MFVIAHQYWTKFRFDSTQNSKELSISMTSIMSMMASQILKSVDFPKTQKSRYLENETLFFLQIKKKFNNYTSGATLQEKYFCSGGKV